MGFGEEINVSPGRWASRPTVRLLSLRLGIRKLDYASVDCFGGGNPRPSGRSILGGLCPNRHRAGALLSAMKSVDL